LFIAGASVNELALKYGIKRATVLQNLERFRAAGGRLDAHRLLASSQLAAADRDRILAAFDQCGLERLTPVRKALGDRIPYEELHLFRLYLKSGGTRAWGSRESGRSGQSR
jgi:ATP-dependent DNA helicase RecQ